MTVRKILTYPSPQLKKIAEPVEEVNDEIRRLLDDMTETMYAAPGLGLAAPQIGVSLRAIVIDVGIEMPDGTRKSNLIQMVNPEIVSGEGEIIFEEGCLSVPEFTYPMKRMASVVVKGLDRNGKEVEIKADGLLAVAFQQEIDHLNGKLIIDNVSRLKRELYRKKMEKRAKGK